MLVDLFSQQNVFSDSDHHPTLKEQLYNYKPGEIITCSNPHHVLVLRPNEQWACVYDTTAWHFKWNLVTFLESGAMQTTTYVMHADRYYPISYQVNNADIGSIQWQNDLSSLSVSIKPVDPRRLVLTIPVGKNTLFENNCNVLYDFIDQTLFMVLINNQESIFELVKVSDSIVRIEIGYDADSKDVEILYICPL